jgi:predicted dehydrogenase
VEAHLTNSGALSIEVAGGRPIAATRFRLEVVGDKGTLALDGGAMRGFPTGRLRLSLNDKPQQVDDGETGSLPDTATNVGGIYAALRDDIAQETWTAPDFAHAVRLARLVEDVLSSAQTGTRRSAADWPLPS